MVVVAVLGGIVLFSVNQANKGVVTVQTAKVATQDNLVSLVTASGEIKPTTYTNVTAQGFRQNHRDPGQGRRPHQEGRPAPAARKTCRPTRTCRRSRRRSIRRSPECRRRKQATRRRSRIWFLQQANLEKAKLDWERGQGLFKDGLIPKQDFDQRKTTYDGAVAAVDSSQARVQSLKAQLDQTRSQVNQDQSGAGADAGRPAEDRLTLRRSTES